MGLSREKLLVEIEARSQGADEFQEAADGLGKLDEAAGKSEKTARRFNRAWEDSAESGKAVSKQIKAIETSYQALAAQINQTGFQALSTQIRDLADVQKNAAAAARMVPLDVGAVATSTVAIEKQGQATKQLALGFQSVTLSAGAGAAAAAKLEQSYGAAADTQAHLAQVTGEGQEANRGFMGTVAAIADRIGNTIVQVEAFIAILERLTSPEAAKRLANLLIIFSALARARGHEKLADGLRVASERTQDLAATTHKFLTDSEMGFQALADRARLFNDVMDGIGTGLKVLAVAAAGFIGLGLVRSFERLSVSAANFAAQTTQAKAAAAAAAKAAEEARRYGAQVQGLRSLAKELGVAEGFDKSLDAIRETDTATLRAAKGMQYMDGAAKVTVQTTATGFRIIKEELEDAAEATLKYSRGVGGAARAMDAIDPERIGYASRSVKEVSDNLTGFGRIVRGVEGDLAFLQARAGDTFAPVAASAAAAASRIQEVFGAISRPVREVFQTIQTGAIIAGKAASAVMQLMVFPAVRHLVEGFKAGSTAGAQAVDPLERALLNLSFVAEVARKRASEFIGAIQAPEPVQRMVKAVQSLASGFGKAAREAAQLDEVAAMMREASAINSTVTGTVKAATASLGEFSGGFKVVEERAGRFIKTISQLNFTKSVVSGAQGAYSSIRAVSASLREAHENGEDFSTIGGLIRDALKGGFGAAAGEVKTFASHLWDLAQIARKGAMPSLQALAESGSHVGPVLFTIGEHALRSEKALVKFGGALAIVAGIMLSGFAAATAIVLSGIGNLAMGIGFTLSDAMDRFAEKNRHLAKVMNEFSFTIKGFGDVLGETAVGDVNYWNDQLKYMGEVTAFTVEQIASSIKLLVAEGSSLGISVDQNTALLKTAADVAAAHGRDLGEVTNAIVKSLVGQSQMLQALGIDVSETSLAHSKYIHTVGKGVNELTQAELVQARYNVILEKAAPVYGAAANELRNINGATEAYHKTLDILQAKLGTQSSIWLPIIEGAAAVLRSINELPQAFFWFAGTLQDATSYALILTGALVKYALLLSSLSALYKLLTVAIAKNAVVQGVLNIVLGTVAARMQLQIVTIKTLRDLMVQLAIIARGALVAAMRALWAMIVALTQKIYALTAALLTNPLFWNAAAVVAVITTVFYALREMSQEVRFLREGIDANNKTVRSASDDLGVFARAWAAVSDFAQQVFNHFKALAKFMASFLSVGILTVVRAIQYMRLQFASAPDEINRLKRSLEEIDKAGREMTLYTIRMANVVTSPWENVARAAGAAKEQMGHATSALKEFLGFNDKINAMSAQAFDPQNLRAQALGDEFQRAAAAYQDANLKFQRALDAAAAESDPAKKKDAEKAAVDARLTAAQSYLSMLKTQQDAVKKVNEQAAQQRMDELRDQNKLVEAARMAGDERLRVFDRDMKSMAQYVGATKQQKAAITAARDQLVKFNEAEIQKAKLQQNQKTQEKAVQAYEDIAKGVKDARLEIAKMTMTSLQAADFEADLAIERVNQTWAELDAVGALTEARKADLLAAIGIARQKADLEKQKKTGGSPVAEGIINATEMATSALGMMAAPMMGVIEAAGGLLDMAQKIVDAIPGLLDKATNLLNSITNFGTVLAKSFKNFLKSIVNLVANFVPNLLQGALDIVATAIDQILIRLPNAFFKLMTEKLPAALMKIVEALPDLAKKFVFGIITFAPKIVVAILDWWVRGIPRIIKALVKMVPVLVRAIIQGLVEAIKFIGELIKGLFTGVFPAMDFADEAKKMVAGVAGASSEIFQLVDAEAIKKGQATAQSVAKSINDAIQRLYSILKMLWNELVAMLKAAWLWVWNTILAPIVALVEKAWQWVVDKILTPLAGVVAAAFQWVIDKVLTPMAGVVAAAWQWVVTNVVQPLQGVGQTIADKITGAISAITSFASGLFDSVKKLFTFDFAGMAKAFSDAFNAGAKLISDAIKAPFNSMITVLNSLGLPEIEWEVDAGKLGSWDGTLIPAVDLIPGNIAYLAQGGLVDAMRSFFSPRGVDTVPAMVQPGEFVVSRRGVATAGTDTLEGFNAGKAVASGGGGVTYQITNHFDIKTTKPVDADLIDKEIAPRVIDKIRRASLDGKRVVSPKGVQK